MDSVLFLQICSLQEVATGELWLQLKQLTDHREHGFCVLDGFIYHEYPPVGYTIIIPKDEELC